MERCIIKYRGKNMSFRTIDKIFLGLRDIQEDFGELTGEYNIYSSSKMYEIIIANMLGHQIVVGTHGADAQNYSAYYEYKHYKESSSNHTWTFNDYTDETLASLKSKTVFFVHINDVSNTNPFKYIDWYYKVDGNVISEYILNWSSKSDNKRKMINISALQLENECRAERIYPTKDCSDGNYSIYINKVFVLINYLERITNTKNLLTSNKLWELFLANKLGHEINSKQGGYGGKYDAMDFYGLKFEYKVSQQATWTFEDVSDAVIDNMRLLDGIYAAIVDKRKFIIKNVFLFDTQKTMDFIKIKRDSIISKKNSENKPVKRLNVTVSLAEATRENLLIG